MDGVKAGVRAAPSVNGRDLSRLLDLLRVSLFRAWPGCHGRGFEILASIQMSNGRWYRDKCCCRHGYAQPGFSAHLNCLSCIVIVGFSLLFMVTFSFAVHVKSPATTLPELPLIPMSRVVMLPSYSQTSLTCLAPKKHFVCVRQTVHCHMA